MQTLWARTAQIRGSCRCPQCLSSVNGVSRRATATATRRMPRYLTSSTLLYSGIFAAAATFDAGVKERRREQWDLAIADVRKELEHTEAIVGQREAKEVREQLGEAVAHFRPFDAEPIAIRPRANAAHGEIEAASPVLATSTEADGPHIKFRDESLGGSDSLDAPTLGTGEEHGDNQSTSMPFKPFFDAEEHDIFRNVDPNRPKAHWPANTGRPLNVYRVAPQSIYATDQNKTGWAETTQVPKKSAATQMAVEMLQLTLFLELQRRGWSEEAAKAVPADFAKHILLDQTEQIRRLKNKRSAWGGLVRADDYLEGYVPLDGDVTLCNFSQIGKRGAKRHWHRLDEALREVFDLEANGSLSRPALFAKVAYNLSITPTAPNVKTFNTLLLGFGRLKDRAVVDPLIAYIRRANVRMDEVTLGAVLSHYTQTNQPANFAHWVKLMRGKYGGLMLARPDVPINETSEGRLMTHEHDPGKVVQLPYPTPHVFKAIIEGVLRFSGFEAALTICQNMGPDGWGLCVKGLTPLLLHCAAQADWTSGSAIWKQIQALKASSRRKYDGKLMSERITFPTYAAMLMLCSKCQRRADFNRVYNEALRERVQADLAVGLKDMVMKQARENEKSAKHKRIGSELVPESHDNEDFFIFNQDEPGEGADGDTLWRRIRLESQHESTETSSLPRISQHVDRQRLRPVGVANQGSESSRASLAMEQSNICSPPDEAQMDMEQLNGRLPPNRYLEDYEIVERPWRLSAACVPSYSLI